MEKIALWAADAGMRAAQLPSSAEREAFLLEIHRVLLAGARGQGLGEEGARALADSCLEGARKVMNELLARGMPSPEGRA